MHVKGVECGVCDFYTTLYTVYWYSVTHLEGVKSVLYSEYRDPLEERLIVAISPVGIAVCQSKVEALFIFWDLSSYKGDCRQHTEPIPNS